MTASAPSGGLKCSISIFKKTMISKNGWPLRAIIFVTSTTLGGPKNERHYINFQAAQLVVNIFGYRAFVKLKFR